MIFPFTIRYEARIKEEVTQENIPMILAYIKDFIIKRTADDIVIEDNSLKFRSRFFKIRWSSNILVPIEKGVFIIISKGDETFLTYEFFMFHLFIFVSLAAVFMATISKQILFGIFAFLWLGGMNWITALIRHRIMLNKLVKEIDELILRSNGQLA